MAESGCILIGRINELSGHEYGKRVYSVDGISPAVVCGGGGGIKISKLYWEIVWTTAFGNLHQKSVSACKG